MSVCFIIPCYNEQDRLPVEALTRYLSTGDKRYFLFVNDGSSDGTENVIAVLEEIFPGRICSVKLERNSGKAEAVRAGMLAAQDWKPFTMLGYMDADLAVPLREIDRFIGIMEQVPGVKVIVGSRASPGATTSGDSIFLAVARKCFACLAGWYIGMRVHDTQCGFKLLDREAAETVFKKPFRTKWIFDVELLARVVRGFWTENGNCPVREEPVENWVRRPGTRIPVHSKFLSMFDLISLMVLNYRER